jgi:hypothetical protein
MCSRPVIWRKMHSYSGKFSLFTDSLWASQYILCLLWYAKVDYRVHKSPPPYLNLRQFNSVFPFTSYLFKIHFQDYYPPIKA